MARITARAGFGEASSYEAVDIDIASDEVYPEYIPAVTQEVAVLNEDGTQVVDEEGNPKTTTETVTAGRMETIEEALVKYLKGSIQVDEVAKSGVENITATINYTISGTIDFDAQDWGIEVEDLEIDADDVDDYYVKDNFDDLIQDAIKEDAQQGWSVEVEYEVDYAEGV